MTGLQLASFWEGNRAELFAAHVLSSIAAVVPVPVQMDFGFDLLCTLTRRDGRSLYAGGAFGIQVKATSVAEATYGGLNDKGAWKNYELEWLYGQGIPFLRCVVDLPEGTVRIYSVERAWWVRLQIGWPGEIVLVPEQDEEEFEGYNAQNRYPRTEVPQPDPAKPVHDGWSYRVPLGSPIVTIKPLEQEPQTYREALRECINSWLDISERNIRHFRMGVPYSEEWSDWSSNEVPTKGVIHHYQNPTLDQNVGSVLSSVGPALTALMNNLVCQNQLGKARALVGAAQLAREYGALDPLGVKLLQLVEEAGDLNGE